MKKILLTREDALKRQIFTFQVDTLEAALEGERKKNSEERSSLVRAHAEINRLKKETQDLKDRSERETQNDQYYQVKVGGSVFTPMKVCSGML